MNPFTGILNLYSKFGNLSSSFPLGLGPTLFGMDLLPVNPDPVLQSLNTTAYNANRFLADGFDTAGPTNSDFADFFINSDINSAFGMTGSEEDNQAFRDYFSQEGDLQTLIDNSPYNKGQLNAALNQFNEQVVTPFNENIGNLRELSPIVGSLAALQDLNRMEANEQSRRQKLNFQNPDLYRVNPTRGIAQAEKGGNMHDTNMKTLPSNYTIPKINLSGTNLNTPDEIPILHLGGGVTYREPLGNYKEGVENRYYSGDDRIPIQAESGGKGKEEMLILPTLDLLPVNAKLRHSQMESDVATDYVPTGSYVASQFGDVVIRKSEAENIVAEVGIKPYDVFGPNPIPTQKTLADLMDKEEMTPADLVRAVKKEFKQVDKESPFAVKTNEENRINSLPYLQGIMLLAEMDKARKGVPSDIDGVYNPPSGVTEIRSEAADEISQLPVFESGGMVRVQGVPKLPSGAMIGLIGSLVSGGIGLANNAASRRQLDRFRRIGDQQIAETEERQTRNNAAGLLGTLAALGLQDTTVEAPQLDTTFINQQSDGIPQSLLDAQIARLYRNNNSQEVFANAPNFAAGVAAQSALNSQANEAANNLFFQNALQSVDRRNTRLSNIQNIVNQQAQLNNSAEAAQRSANNNRLAGIGSAISGFFQTDSNIAGNATTATLANLGQQVSGNLQLNSQQAQTVANTLAGVQQFLPQMFAGQTQQNRVIQAPASIGPAPGLSRGVTPSNIFPSYNPRISVPAIGSAGASDCILGRRIDRNTGADLGPC